MFVFRVVGTETARSRNREWLASPRFQKLHPPHPLCELCELCGEYTPVMTQHELVTLCVRPERVPSPAFGDQLDDEDLGESTRNAIEAKLRDAEDAMRAVERQMEGVEREMERLESEGAFREDREAGDRDRSR